MTNKKTPKSPREDDTNYQVRETKTPPKTPDPGQPSDKNGKNGYEFIE